jgi:hypothetical protein
MRRKERRGPGIVTVDIDAATGFGTSEGIAAGGVSDEPSAAAELQTLTDRQTPTNREALSRKRGFTAGPSSHLRNDLMPNQQDARERRSLLHQ